MGEQNKMKNTKNSKKDDGKFRSKHISHNPQDESARAKWGLQNTTSDGDAKTNSGNGG